MTAVDIATFNALEPAAAATLVRTWAAIPPWVDAVVAGRPYASTQELHERAADLARDWTPEQVEAALADHPRIGERPTGTGAGAAASRAEQASSADADATTAEAIRQGNVAYEARFGRVFLIRAAGRSADEILRELRRRLDDDDATERREVAEQLRAIALLRLDGSTT